MLKFLGIIFLLFFGMPISGKGMQFSDACSEKETWKNIPSEVAVDFSEMIAGDLSPLKGFAVATKVLKFSPSPEAKLFSRYFIARSLYQAKLKKASESVFLGLYLTAPPDQDPEITYAAFECLNKIYTAIPGIALPSAARELLVSKPLPYKPQHQFIQAELFFRTFLVDLSETPFPQERAQKILMHLKDSLYEKPAVAFWETLHHNHKGVIEAVLTFQKKNHPLNAPFEGLNDVLTLILARAYFHEKNYHQAYLTFKSIPNTSRFFVEAIGGQSWSELNAKHYENAIGSGLGTQVLWLRNVFIPETHLVGAMALNELCRYPEALKVVRYLVRRYRAIWTFLMHRPAPELLYNTTVHILKEKNPTLGQHIPIEVVREWIQSKTFIQLQGSMNRLIEDENHASHLAKQYEKEQEQWVQVLLRRVTQINEDLIELQGHKKTDLQKIKKIKHEITKFKLELSKLNNFITIKPLLVVLYQKFITDKKKLNQEWIHHMNKTFESINQDILNRMKYVILNMNALNAEIYDGAGKDLIWRNAHPNVKMDIPVNPSTSSFDAYDWGSSRWNLIETGEVWEDEVNALAAGLKDNCKNVNKYIAVPVRK